MPDSLPTLPLLLFGDQASSVWSLAGDDLRYWSAAFDDWLAGLERDRNPDYRQKHWRAWADFLAFSLKPPWEVAQADLERWVAHLTTRGLVAATICNKLRYLSHFYDFAAAHLPPYSLERSGASPIPSSPAPLSEATPPSDVLCRRSPDPISESTPLSIPAPLHPSDAFCRRSPALTNPLRGFRPLRSRDYSRIIYLPPQEARRLLAAFDRETSVLAKRDYALVLAHLLTGLESGRLLALRWGDITGEGAGVALPEAVWAAVNDYLSASGRLPGIHPEHYIFAPLADALHKPSGLQPEDWNPARPVTREVFNRSLRIYARCAGLRPELINPRALRYSAVMLRIESGDTAEELAAFLGRSDLDKVKEGAWRLLEADLPDLLQDTLDQGAAYPTSRNRSGGGQPGNLNGLKHGLYASHLPAEDFEGVDELPLDSLEEEIRVLRVAIRRTLACLGEAQTLDESCHYLEVLGMAAGRLARMMKTHHELRSGQGEAAQALDQVIHELGIE